MKRISVFALIFALMLCVVHAQDSAMQQQIDQINGKLQDLVDSQAAQGKRLDALEKQLSDLADKVNTPAINNSASVDDLKKLAEQLQEVDKKRQDDRELILKEIEKIGKVAAEVPVSTSRHNKDKDTSSDSGDSGSAPATTVDGYEYTVKAGDTLSIIAKAYRDQHIRVTVSQILKANPGLDANKLYVGKKIIIPKSSQ